LSTSPGTASRSRRQAGNLFVLPINYLFFSILTVLTASARSPSTAR